MTHAVAGDLNSAMWCADCMATTEDVWSACAHCGMDVVTSGVPSGCVYCADCTASGAADYDRADRAGEVATSRAMNPDWM